MLGVSPAFFFSLYTTDFKPMDYLKGFEKLRELGLSIYQPEIFKEEYIGLWEEQASLVHDAAFREGLTASQFVAHFMLNTLSCDTELFSDHGIEEFRHTMEAASVFTETHTVTIPLAAYTTDGEGYDYWTRWNRFVEKMGIYADIAAEKGFDLALEILPKSFLENTDGLLRLIADSGRKNLGFNFDSGHVANAGEVIELVPSKLCGRIFGAHIKDSGRNWIPGDGDIDWKKTIEALRAAGYDGSLDMEFPLFDMSEEKIMEEYRRGRDYLLSYDR